MRDQQGLKSVTLTFAWGAFYHSRDQMSLASLFYQAELPSRFKLLERAIAGIRHLPLQSLHTHNGFRLESLRPNVCQLSFHAKSCLLMLWAAIIVTWQSLRGLCAGHLKNSQDYRQNAGARWT